MFKNKTEQNRNDEKSSQTGITVEIHTNHDGVRATAILLRSYAASSSLRYYKTNREALAVLCSLVKHLGSGEVERNTRIRFVFLPTLLSCSNRFLCALQQNRTQLRLLYLLNGIFIIRFQDAKVWNDISGDIKLLSLECFNTKVKSILIAICQL